VVCRVSAVATPSKDSRVFRARKSDLEHLRSNETWQ
jgi:hypothetical protein